MKQEYKELLLKDLSARLPYGVEVNYKENEYDIRHWKIDSLHTPTYSERGILIDTDYEGWISFTEYKGCGMSTGSRPLHIEKNLPFLRPMSSMTEDEYEQYRKFSYYGAAGYRNNDYKEMIATPSFEKLDFLNAHHFDYRGLIEKGLALEAPEGMYQIK